jgi:hypothetical protein
MGFADLAIAEITTNYSIPVEKVFSVYDQLGIANQHQKTRLVLRDAKAIIWQILSEYIQKETLTRWLIPESPKRLSQALAIAINN